MIGLRQTKAHHVAEYGRQTVAYTLRSLLSARNVSAHLCSAVRVWQVRVNDTECMAIVAGLLRRS